MVTHTITLHECDGRIAWQWVTHGFAPEERYIGTVPWAWIADSDRDRVKAAFAFALMGECRAAVKYQLDVQQHGGHWTAETFWARLPTHDLPIVGISRTYSSVVDNLSAREKQIAKLLPSHTAKQIARELNISTSTVESFRGRIGIKINFSGNELIAWCSEHHDFL